MPPEIALLPGMSRRRFVRTGVGALAAPVFLGCGNSSVGPGEGSAPDPRLTSRPGAPTSTPELGSSQLGLGSARDGVLYIPTTYRPDTAMPLFVALHGHGGSGHHWANYQARAESRGMVLLAPDSRGTTWDLALGDFGPDVDFLDEALQYTFDICRIDPSRIALGGFSDGASYALSLGASNGDLFSHLIAYSPGFFIPSEPIVGKPHVFVSHGTEDPILPVTTSRDFIVPTLRDSGYDVVYEEFIGGHEVPAAIPGSTRAWFPGPAGGN